MGDTLTVYNLGAMGVNVDTTPIHGSDGEMIQAQNAQFDVAGNKGGLRKRFGMTKLNSGSLGGRVQGVFNVQLDDPTTPGTPSGWYVVCRDAVAGPTFGYDSYRYSTDLASWGAVTNFVPNLNAQITATQRVAEINGAFYTPAGFSDPRVFGVDGGSAREVVSLPLNADGGTAQVQAVYAFNGLLYIVATYSTSTTEKGRVYSLDPLTGALLQLGGVFGTATGAIANEYPSVVFSAFGRLWLYCTSTTGYAGHLYSNYGGATDAWVSERAITTHLQVTGGAEYNGALYVTEASLHTANNANAIVEKRTSDGTWTTDLTSPDSNDGNFYSLPTLFNGSLYFIYRNTTGTVRTQLKKNASGSYSTAIDLLANSVPLPVQLRARSYGATELLIVVGTNAVANGDPIFYRVSIADALTSGALVKAASFTPNFIAELRN